MQTNNGVHSGSLAEQCQLVARRLLARNNWQLVEAGDLAALAVAEFAARQDLDGEHGIERLMLSLYVEIMYVACSGAEGRERRELGYAELSRSLNGVARAKYADVAEDAAGEALAETIANFERCRKPRAFLHFALQRLWTCVRRLRRQDSPNGVSLDQAVSDADETPLSERIEDVGSDPAEAHIGRELADAVARAAEQFRSKHPRARDQFAALYLKYIDDLSDGEIGLALGTTPENVHVLRSRAKTKLRNDATWRALASDEEAQTDAVLNDALENRELNAS